MPFVLAAFTSCTFAFSEKRPQTNESQKTAPKQSIITALPACIATSTAVI